MVLRVWGSSQKSCTLTSETKKEVKQLGPEGQRNSQKSCSLTCESRRMFSNLVLRVANSHKCCSLASEMRKEIKQFSPENAGIYQKSQSLTCETNNILSGAQFGFRPGHSTVHPMVHFVNHVSKALNNKEHSIAIFCELRKAFDSCDHEILLRKLSRVGIRGNTLAWFKNYLSNRQQFVTVAGFNSSVKVIRLGVPQGSILGPILFLLYIYDLPLNSLLNDFLFADDTTLLASGPDLPELVEFVNSEFHKICTYFRQNKLVLHPGKTQFALS